MKIYRISVEGLASVSAHLTVSRTGNKFYQITHGEEGRGRWQIRLPLAAREFPPNDNKSSILLDGDYKIVNLQKTDSRNNPLHIIAKGELDDSQLILWKLSPGYRGSVSYEIRGNARIIAVGQEAQGAAGRMGGADCPIVFVGGPCQLVWTRYGRLYGGKPKWVAEFDGTNWNIAPSGECALEDAALSY